jgi:hypothetical protein
MGSLIEDRLTHANHIIDMFNDRFCLAIAVASIQHRTVNLI